MLAEAAAIMSRREAPRYAFLLRINTAKPLRLWTGVGDLETDRGDDLDPSQVYSGIGILTGLPAIRQLIGGIAEQLTITMSGVDAIPQSYVDDEDSDIVGAEINIGIVFFDDDWQQVGPSGWIWSGTVGPVTSEFGGGVETVSLSVASEFLDRSRASPRFWSNAGHQSRHPGDTMCQFTAALSEGTTIKWPG